MRANVRAFTLLGAPPTGASGGLEPSAALTAKRLEARLECFRESPSTGSAAPSRRRCAASGSVTSTRPATEVGWPEALSRDVPLARALAIGADWRLIQKALVSLLAGNFGELLVTLLAGVVGLPLPLLPLQLL